MTSVTAPAGSDGCRETGSWSCGGDAAADRVGAAAGGVVWRLCAGVLAQEETRAQIAQASSEIVTLLSFLGVITRPLASLA
jgi:hypothetical protein